MGRKLAPTVVTLSNASRVLNVPGSTLKYHVMAGNIRKRVYGLQTLVDVDEVQEALQIAGYTPRRKRANK